MKSEVASPVKYRHLVEDEGTTTSSRHRHIIWRIINGVMTIFFALSAYVQINDALPFLWVPAYLIPSLITLTVTIKPHQTDGVIWQTVTAVHMSICLTAALYKAVVVAELIKEEIHNPLVHMEGRELAGLLIVVVWLGLCRFSSVGSSETVGGVSKTLLLMTFIIGLIPLLLWTICFVEDFGKDVGHCQDMFPGLLGQPLL